MPVDWAVENRSPAKFYQHCLPNVLRHINSVTDTSDEVSRFLHGKRVDTTDQWETAHFQSMTGDWDHELSIWKDIGFSAVFDAEQMIPFKDDEEFPSVFGYFDEGMLLFLACVS